MKINREPRSRLIVSTWSSAFVFFMGGWAMWILSICYAVADIFMYRKWAGPFLVFGTNAIFVFVGSGIIGRSMLATKINMGTDAEAKWVGLKTLFYDNVMQKLFNNPGMPFHDPKLASWAYSVVYILFWLALTYPLYRKKIFRRFRESLRLCPLQWFDFQ